MQGAEQLSQAILESGSVLRKHHFIAIPLITIFPRCRASSAQPRPYCTADGPERTTHLAYPVYK
jgi:hypothetical protein